MEIAVRIDPNGRTYIDKNLRPEIDYTKPPYNFTIKTIDDQYSDCEGSDFDGLEFSVEKYNARKKRETNEPIILQLKQNLAQTDYQAIKYSEGELTTEEYESIKQQRREWRAEINRLESEVQDVNL